MDFREAFDDVAADGSVQEPKAPAPADSGLVKRTYTVEGNPESIAAFERFLDFLKYTQAGASRVCKFSADGDGDFRLKVMDDLQSKLGEKEIETLDNGDEISIGY